MDFVHLQTLECLLEHLDHSTKNSMVLEYLVEFQRNLLVIKDMGKGVGVQRHTKEEVRESAVHMM